LIGRVKDTAPKFNIMKKRTFLKLSSAMITGAAIAPIAACKMEQQQEKLKNWAGNLTYSTTNILEPKTVEEVQEFVKECNKVRTLGTRHCFNKIADSNKNLLSTKYLTGISAIDTDARTITVGAGIRYGEFCHQIHEQDLLFIILHPSAHFCRRSMCNSHAWFWHVEWQPCYCGIVDRNGHRQW
jgi:xylitol oxidase